MHTCSDLYAIYGPAMPFLYSRCAAKCYTCSLQQVCCKVLHLQLCHLCNILMIKMLSEVPYCRCAYPSRQH